MTFPWREIIESAVEICATPFFLCAWEPVLEALSELESLEGGVPIRHWFSFKTQPVKPLIENWRDAGLGVEVVSEYELRAALEMGFLPERILVNGVGKHTWLPNYRVKGMRVHFDSVGEAKVLAQLAAELEWNVGVRIHVSEEFDPDEPNFGAQFGLSASGALSCVNMIREAGLDLESIHFHLRSNVETAQAYRNAINEVSDFCQRQGLQPKYLDCGGGFPPPKITNAEGSRLDSEFHLSELRTVLEEAKEKIPSIKEIWFENGRFVTSRSSVLVVRVIDIKNRPESRYLICDGGRTNHALVSDWELHDVFTVPQKTGLEAFTTICGPTCMAFDRLRRLTLPKAIEVGDIIVWCDAGAYHIPWENHFSSGLAAVVWCNDAREVSIARSRETYRQWWQRWN